MPGSKVSGLKSHSRRSRAGLSQIAAQRGMLNERRSTRPEPREQTFKQWHEEKLRERPAAGNRSRRHRRNVVNRRHRFIVRDFVIFLAFGLEVSRPEEIQIQAARIAHSAVILHVLAFRALENERSMARRAELHALWIRRAAFLADHAEIVSCTRRFRRTRARRRRYLVNPRARRMQLRSSGGSRNRSTSLMGQRLPRF